MTLISDFADVVNQSFSELAASVDGVVSDVAALKAKIDELQNSGGQITPEDQLLLDDIQAKAKALAAKVKALDDATENPPVPQE